MIVRRPSGFIEPCLPSKAARPPSGPLWVHEIKHDGYRLMVRRDGARVRCFTRNGHDWADRFPAIVEAAQRLKAQSFLIDGEAVIARDDGTPDFHALRSRRRGHEAVLFAFDLIEHDGDDLRDLPLIERKRRLAKLQDVPPGVARECYKWLLCPTQDDPTWPVRTEGDNRQVGVGNNALASSIVLVCRNRPIDAPKIVSIRRPAAVDVA
jgi:ATP dependent DNA ligase domain